MTEHLNRASEYLALAESQLTGSPSDNLFLAIARSLVGALVHLNGSEVDEVVEDTSGQELELLSTEGNRVCVLCGRRGSRQFEDSAVGLVCTHVIKCAERRHTPEEETQ